LNKITDLGVNKNCFSIIHFNIRSAHRNLDKADYFLQAIDMDFTVVALSETWLNRANSSCYCLDGYNMLTSCREGRMGGGVALLIKEPVDYASRGDLSVFNENFESMFVEISHSQQTISVDRDIIIGVIYRPPGTKLNDFIVTLSDILHRIKVENKLVYLCGDFNINILHSDSHLPTSDFIDTMYSASFFPLITKPTRVTNDNATLNDNIFCNDINNYEHMNGIFCNDITDHYPIFSINHGCQTLNRPRYMNVRVINNTKKGHFINSISQCCWNQVCGNDNAKMAFEEFYKTYCNVYHKCFPIKRVKVGYYNKKSWLTSGLKESIKRKNKLYAILRKHPSDFTQNRYKIYKTALAKLLKKCERDHYDNLFKLYRNNLKKSWDVIKQVINRNRPKLSQCKFKLDDQYTSDGQTIAEHFNKFFTNIGSTLSNKIPQVSTDPVSYINGENSSIYLDSVSEQEISQIIKGFKSNASGYDNIKAGLRRKLITCT